MSMMKMGGIVDRRFDSKKRSAVNKQRFFRRYKGQIRKAVSDAIAGRSITDIESGESISIPTRDIGEPQFATKRGSGESKQVYAGNDQFAEGDQVPRPMEGGQGRGSGAANEGTHEDDFTFQLSREDFLNIFFDDLALPNLIKTQLLRINEWKSQHAGIVDTDSTAGLNILGTFRKAMGRWFGLGYKPERMRALEAEILRLIEEEGRTDSDPEVFALTEELRGLRMRANLIPFIDNFDLKRNARVKQPTPSADAVMFCVMDVSGSMDEEKKQIAKRFFMLLYLFLTRVYEHIELVFIRHHTVAQECNEQDFFTSRESGGTVVSSALELMRDIVHERYLGGGWNIYGAQLSDGDNWENDSPIAAKLLSEDILPYLQYFCYIEIAAKDPQNLWREYAVVQGAFKNFAIQRIEEFTDIYPVFHKLFKKKLA